MMKASRMRWLLLSVSLCAAAAGCSAPRSRPRAGADERLPRMETVQPTRTTFPVQIELAATVEPLEKADLCARVQGVVDGMPPVIDIGKAVKAGETLVVLAVPDLVAQKKQKESLLSQAQQQLALATVGRELAEREWKESVEQEKRYKAEKQFRDLELARKMELARRDVLARQLVEETQLQAEAAGAAWDAARAQIASKDARRSLADTEIKVAGSRVQVAEADLRQVEEQIGFATIKAPFDGVITRRWVDRGATIKDPGTPLLTVMYTSTVRVLLDIPERHVPLASVGRPPRSEGMRDPVVLRIPALRDVVPGGEFTGTVARIATAVDPNTRTMRAEVHLDNSSGFLRPGMYGTATLHLEDRTEALMIPSTALVRREGRTFVYYVDEITGDPPRGVVKRAEVELGIDDGKRVEIRNDRAFRGDERIIAKGNGVVRQGDTVIPVPLRPAKD
jgi:RND family efflux transporter MFP subunit